MPGGPRRFTEAIVGGMIRHQAAGQPGHVGGGSRIDTGRTGSTVRIDPSCCG